MRDNADDKHLLDDLRHIEGFPIGEDEDLQALSDPPHYTAYPNPHIAEFIEKWGQPYDEATDDYHREPFVADVSDPRARAALSTTPTPTTPKCPTRLSSPLSSTTPSRAISSLTAFAAPA